MKKNSKTLRTLTAAAVIVVIAVGFVTNLGIGTISAPGIWDISILCPLGALGTMLASKMMVPRAVVSLVIMALLIVLFARAFCGWMCPVPLVQRLRGLFAKKPSEGARASAADAGTVAASAGDADAAAAGAGDAQVKAEAKPLTDAERSALAASCGASGAGCASCAAKRGGRPRRAALRAGRRARLDVRVRLPGVLPRVPHRADLRDHPSGHQSVRSRRRHLVAHRSAGAARRGSARVQEVVIDIRIVSAFMSLIAKANKTFVPTIDDAKCLETAKGATCGLCGRACDEGIDPRHPQLSKASWSECTKCRACVDACPTSAITMPLLRRSASGRLAPPLPRRASRTASTPKPLKPRSRP